MDSWEFDDEDGDDGAASPAAAGDFDPFGDEDASSDGSGGAWDDSSDDEAEKLPKKGGGKKLGGKQKSGRELARAKSALAAETLQGADLELVSFMSASQLPRDSVTSTGVRGDAEATT